MGTSLLKISGDYNQQSDTNNGHMWLKASVITNQPLSRSNTDLTTSGKGICNSAMPLSDFCS